jgi:hypothetical protein
MKPVPVFSSAGARDVSVHANSRQGVKELRTRRQVTGLCVISCEVNNCSSAKER